MEISFLNEEDSDEDDFIVTIGEIKTGLPFQKQPRTGGANVNIDLDADPTLKDGTPIYDLDLAALEDKPWRKPGSDLTDYFNYGFNEETWNQYCERQRKFRQEFGTDQAAINKTILSNIQLSGAARLGLNIDFTKPPPNFDPPILPPSSISNQTSTIQPPPNFDPAIPPPSSISNQASTIQPPPNFDPAIPPPSSISNQTSSIQQTQQPTIILQTNLSVDLPLGMEEDGPPGVTDYAPGVRMSELPPSIPRIDFFHPPPTNCRPKRPKKSINQPTGGDDQRAGYKRRRK